MSVDAKWRFFTKFPAKKIMFAISRRIYTRDFWHTRAFFTNIWPRSVRLRANCTANEEVLCQPKDAALKFRGCFQAVCETPGVPIGWRGLVTPEGGMVYGRQGVVVLEPTYRATEWPSAFLSFFFSLFRALFFPPHPFDLPDPPIFFSLTLLIILVPLLPYPRSSIHFPPFICFAHRPRNERLPRDVLLIGSLRQPRIRRAICMNYFSSLDDSLPRVDKRTNKEQHLTFCQVNDYSCAKGL